MPVHTLFEYATHRAVLAVDATEAVLVGVEEKLRFHVASVGNVLVKAKLQIAVESSALVGDNRLAVAGRAEGKYLSFLGCRIVRNYFG